MANNIFTGPNSTVARVNMSFADMGLTTSNVAVIYEVGPELKMWVPSSEINGITGCEAGKGYYIIAKADLDLTAYFIPPIPTGGPSTPPVANAGPDVELATETTSFVLNGSGSFDLDGQILSYEWTQVSGPTTATLSTPNQVSCTASGLQPGNYRFRLKVIDNLNLYGEDDVIIKIRVPQTMSITGGTNNNIYNTENGQKAWLVYPEGYDADREEGYPLIIFLHGAGENGSDPNILATAPYNGLAYLTYQGQKTNCCIVIPQLEKLTEGGVPIDNPPNYWTAPKVHMAYEYALENMNIDTNRVYCTGLSSGGAGSLQYAYLYGDYIAAALVFSPSSSPTEVDGASIKNLPLRFYQGIQDEYVGPPQTLQTPITMNAAVPKGIFPPQVRTVFNGVHGPDVWNDFGYDKSKAPYDFEEWLLLHHIDKEVTAENYVVLAENSPSFENYATAKTICSRLPVTTKTTELLNRLSEVYDGLKSDGEYFIIDFGHSSNPSVPGLNRTTSHGIGASISNLSSLSSVSSVYGFEVVSGSNTAVNNALMDNEYFGIASTAFKDAVQIQGATTWKLTGLPTSSVFNLSFLYGDLSTDRINRTGTEIIVDGARRVSMDDSHNTMNTVNFYNVRPNSSGEIEIFINNAYGNASNITALMLKEKEDALSPTVAKFFFSLNIASLAGWTNMFGNPNTLKQGTSNGITLKTVPGNWGTYFGFYASDNDGGSVNPSDPYYPAFPQDATRGTWINSGLSFNGTNYSFETAPLSAGKYQVRVFGSVKSSILPSATNVPVNVKFGTGVNQLQYINEVDNTDTVLYFEGFVPANGVIKLGVYDGLTNAIIIEKID